MDNATARLDVRLVPAALTGWAVTAAGIWWPVGKMIAALSLTLTFGAGAVLWYRGRRPMQSPGGRVIGTSLAAIGIVGAGFGLAIALRVDAVRHHPLAAAWGTAARVTVMPTQSVVAVGRGRFMFSATLRCLENRHMSGRVIVFARESESGPTFGELLVGQPVRFTARISRPLRRDLTVAVLNATGPPIPGPVGLVQRSAYTVRDRFAAAARAALPTDLAAMLPALVLGDTSAVSSTMSSEFRIAGLTHLTAVSGANVTIVCAAALCLGRLIGPRAAVGMAALALVAFVIVVQPSASVLRAAVMGAIALLGILSARRRQALPALSATVLVLLVATPQLAVDVGFALSVVATAALMIIAPVWSRRLVAQGWPKLPADALAVACAAHLVTAPLIAGIAGRFSLLAVVANLAVAALIAPITVLGSTAAVLGLVWPAGAQLLIRFTGPELWWVLHVAHWTAGVPGAAVPVPAGLPGVLMLSGIATLVLVLWRQWWFRVVLGSALVTAALCALSWWVTGRCCGGGYS